LQHPKSKIHILIIKQLEGFFLKVRKTRGLNKCNTLKEKYMPEQKTEISIKADVQTQNNGEVNINVQPKHCDIEEIVNN